MSIECLLLTFLTISSSRIISSRIAIDRRNPNVNAQELNQRMETKWQKKTLHVCAGNIYKGHVLTQIIFITLIIGIQDMS